MHKRLLVLVVLLAMVPVSVMASETYCFSDECFNVNKADGMLVDGYNLPQGEYEITSKTTTAEGSEIDSLGVEIRPNNTVYMWHKLFDATMNMSTGVIEEYHIRHPGLNDKEKKLIKTMIESISGKFKQRGYVKSGDILKDDITMPLGQLGSVKFNMKRNVLGITTYNGKNYAVVISNGSGKVNKYKINASVLSLHDPNTGIAMYSWMGMEFNDGNNIMRFSMKQELTILAK